MSVPFDPTWPEVDAANSALGAQLMSDYRVKEGLHPLVVLPSLQQPAEWKARDMAGLDYASHDDPPQPLVPNGRSWATRDEDFGYIGALGEVIAWGTVYGPDGHSVLPMPPGEALAEWVATPGEGHYVVIHIQDYNACGYAVANDKSGSAFHVCVFGIASSVPPPPVNPPPIQPPSPLPTPPVKGSHWRLRVNPASNQITVVGYVSGSVLSQNKKGQPLDPLPLVKFLKKYVQV